MIYDNIKLITNKISLNEKHHLATQQKVIYEGSFTVPYYHAKARHDLGNTFEQCFTNNKTGFTSMALSLFEEVSCIWPFQGKGVLEPAVNMFCLCLLLQRKDLLPSLSSAIPQRLYSCTVFFWKIRMQVVKTVLPKENCF